MNIDPTIRTMSLVKVTPSEPLTVEGNSFDFGLDQSKIEFTAPDQAYGMSGAAQSATSTVNLVAGTMSGGGTGTFSVPTGGKDADGVTISLDRIQLVEIRNTGSVDLTCTFSGFADAAVIPLNAGGRFLLASKAGVDVSTATVAIAGTGAGSAWSMVVMGKKTA